jgi:3-hydroxyisobutyrate dehydrogenase
MRVGFIGLGRMGAPMARNVLEAGHMVGVHDVRRESAAELEAVGARWVGSAADLAAGAEVLVTMLPGPPQVEAVMLGEGGAFAAMAPGSVWVDMSTSTPDAGRRAAALGRGVGVVDAPVSGMVKGAIAGRLQIFVGGDAADVARVRPVLECMGDPERIFHVGPRGAGYAVKLAINLLWFIHVAAAAEVLQMGVRAGVDLDVLQRSLAASPANSLVIERDILPVWQGDYDESFTLDLVTKDLGLAVDLGRQTGTPMEVSALVEQLHRRARALYGDKAGELAAVKLYEDATGTLLRPSGGA